MAYGRITSSSGRELNLTPAGWINNEGENLNDAPGNALSSALSGRGGNVRPAQEPAPNALMQQLQPQVELDVKRPVEVFGKGKGFFAKNDPYSIYDVNGNKIADVGNNQAASRKMQKEDLALEASRANIAHTKAQTDAMRSPGGAKTPPGYRVTNDGNLEAIPGGPADLKMQGAFNQDTAALYGSSSSFDRLSAAANEAMNHPGLSGITGIRSMIPNLPGTDAADAQAKLNTLKSQVGFGVLQDMRNNSKTGGALGAISDAEGKRLEANLAALENAQSEKQMKESLKKIIEYSQGAKDRLQSAYNMRHGGQRQQPAQQQPAGGYEDPGKEQRYQQWLKSQGR